MTTSHILNTTKGTELNQLNSPQSIDIENGYIYVADTENHRILKFKDEGDT